MSAVVVEVAFDVGHGKADGFTPTTLRMAFERAGGVVPRMMRHIGPELSRLFEGEMRNRHASEGAYGGASAWAELTKPYREWKERTYPGRKKLVLRGSLRKALTSSQSPSAFRAIGDSEFGFGTRGVEYASFHQYGTLKMVARPPIEFKGRKFDAGMRTAVQRGFVAAMRAARAEGLL